MHYFAPPAELPGSLSSALSSQPKEPTRVFCHWIKVGREDVELFHRILWAWRQVLVHWLWCQALASDQNRRVLPPGLADF